MNSIKHNLNLKASFNGLVPARSQTPSSVQPRYKIWLAFAAVYLIWGSTYLALRAGIETISPWLLAFSRFALAGGLALGLARLKREPALEAKEVLLALSTGVLLIGSNGLVAMAEQTLASGLVAVVIGAMPIWIMLLGWLFFSQARPTLLKTSGALFGFLGILLIAQSQLQGGAISTTGLPLLFVSSALWAFGTLMQGQLKGLKSLFRFSGLQMLAGSISAGVMALLFEKPWQLSLADISLGSWISLLYLAIFGSVVGFTAYTWLSRNVDAQLVSTYALVNPVIAVGLGWLVYREPVSGSFALAVACVLIGVGMMLKKPAAEA